MQERHAPTLLESALRHDPGVMLVVLGAVPIAAWLWIVLMARDMYGAMTGAAAWMMTGVWNWPDILLLAAMWAVMMTAMMLPTAAPLILLYAAASRRSAESAPARGIYALASGYLTVWVLFSIVLTALQRLLASTFVLTPMMEPASPIAGAVLLGVAGVYQLTPIKRACLRACRSPLGFMMQRWRAGAAGAFRLGISHGTHCLGCCWALMLILFAGGVMNLAVILTLTVWVLVEKAAPIRRAHAHGERRRAARHGRVDVGALTDPARVMGSTRRTVRTDRCADHSGHSTRARTRSPGSAPPAPG